MSRKLLSSIVLALFVFSAIAGADEELEKRASWKQPTAAEVKVQIDEWLSAKQVDEPTKAKVDTMWSQDAAEALGTDVLDRLVATISLVDNSTKDLVDLCRSDQRPLPLPKFDLLKDTGTPSLVRNNLRLHYARWLARQDFYDESLAEISDLKPEDVVDPASLLFYQSVAHHRLLDKEKCLPAISKLLENKGAIPRRYETVAMLMESDLKPLKTDSLDEVSRLMDDIERRLGFARAGTRVRKEEDDVIAKLDKMIEELEKQQQQSSSSSSSGGMNPSRPMPDSMPGGGSGPGNVEQKRIGSRSDWGNLPPKQRQEALQQIAKGLPAHYREVIEEYFRKLARDGNN
jgi:hypothetical protein